MRGPTNLSIVTALHIVDSPRENYESRIFLAYLTYVGLIVHYDESNALITVMLA